MCNETTAGGGGVSLTVAVAVEFGFATDAALIVTLDDEGIVVGAV